LARLGPSALILSTIIADRRGLAAIFNLTILALTHDAAVGFPLHTRYHRHPTMHG